MGRPPTPRLPNAHGDALAAIHRLVRQWNGGLSAEDEGAPDWDTVEIAREDIEALKCLLDWDLEQAGLALPPESE